MGASTLEIVLSALVAILVPVLSLWAKNSMDRRADAEERVNKRLQEQRADFNTLLNPLKEELARLQSKTENMDKQITKLEERLDAEERDSRLLLATLYEAIQTMSNAIPPLKVYLPPRVQELLSVRYSEHCDERDA